MLVFFGLMAISLAALLLLPPILQDQSYHQFADQRTMLGIPNFWNVISNLPFLAVGVAGLRRFRNNPATFVFFLGVFLTGIGSSYYHWDPNDDTLFWDRLPMTLAFAAILALVVEERVSTKVGSVLLWPALATGLFSLLLWRWTGDLRLYFWVQFFPGLAIVLLFLASPPKYTGVSYWIAAGALYALAKVFEFTDKAILFGRKLAERTHPQASCGRGCVLGNSAIFPDPTADPRGATEALRRSDVGFFVCAAVSAESRTAIGRTDGCPAQTVASAIWIGIRMNAPAIPHSVHQKNTANSTMKGETETAVPATRGSM